MPENDEQDYSSLDKIIELILKQLKHLPPFIQKSMEKELEEFLRLVRERRPAHLMLFGRRGSGKSTLINAIFNAQVRSVGAVKAQTGEAEWLEYRHGDKMLYILDTRGIQEGSTPAERDSESNSEQSVFSAIQHRCPDLILFLVKAKEVDAAIHGDIEALEKVHAEIDRNHKRSLPIIGVLTQCDELDPPDIRNLPTDDEEKNNNIREASDLLDRHLASNDRIQKSFVGVIPTVAYVRYRQDGTQDPERDYRWNIDKLVESVFEELPDQAKLQFVRLAEIRKHQKKLANRAVNLCSLACGAIGTQPIPIADLPVLTSIQTAMIWVVAYLSGRELSLKSAGEFLAAMGINIGAAFALREGVRALVKLIPGYGNFVSGAIAAGATKAIGQAAIAYYIDERPIEEIKTIFKRKGREDEAS